MKSEKNHKSLQLYFPFRSQTEEAVVSDSNYVLLVCIKCVMRTEPSLKISPCSWQRSFLHLIDLTRCSFILLHLGKSTF